MRPPQRGLVQVGFSTPTFGQPVNYLEPTIKSHRRHSCIVSASVEGEQIPMEDIVPTERPQQQSLWVSLVEAIRGSHQDYTRGSLNRAILLLAVPMVLEMVLESLFAVVDVFWVGRLGANAIATVGLSESLLSLIFSVGMGLSLSTTAMVARRIGERDPEGAAVAGVQAIALGLGVSVAIGVPCFLLAPQLLHLMGASPEIIAVGI